MTTTIPGSTATLEALFFEFAGGPAADLTGMTITITSAAGGAPIVGPTPTGIVHIATGIYTYAWVVDSAQALGDYIAVWSGTDSSSDTVTATEIVTVEPAPAGAATPFVTVAEVKAHMKKTDSGDDAELAGFVVAACQMIVDRIGQVTPVVAVDITPTRRLHGRHLVLEQRPVISITTVEAFPGGTLIPEANLDAGVGGWELVGDEGVLKYSHAGWGCRELRITYVAGRDPLPGNYRLAALELASHLWRASHLNASGGRPPVAGQDEMTIRNVPYALPYRVRELLGLGQLQRDEIPVG